MGKKPERTWGESGPMDEGSQPKKISRQQKIHGDGGKWLAGREKPLVWHSKGETGLYTKKDLQPESETGTGPHHREKFLCGGGSASGAGRHTLGTGMLIEKGT